MEFVPGDHLMMMFQFCLLSGPAASGVFCTAAQEVRKSCFFSSVTPSSVCFFNILSRGPREHVLEERVRPMRVSLPRRELW